MRNLILVMIALLSVVACKPSFEPPKQESPSWEVRDSSYNGVVEVVDTVEDLTAAPMTVQIYDDRVVISSPNVNTVYSVDVTNLYVRRTETGLVKYIRVNNDILFEEKSTSVGGVNHNYTYLENGWIEVQRGNTIDGIIADHAKEYPGISRKSLHRCNPFLKRGLQVNDRIKLSCR